VERGARASSNGHRIIVKHHQRKARGFLSDPNGDPTTSLSTGAGTNTHFKNIFWGNSCASLKNPPPTSEEVVERSQTSQVGSPYILLAVSEKKTAGKKRYNENAFRKNFFILCAK
jgi:hypothetical protein